MSRPRPKFCVGELAIRLGSITLREYDKAEIKKIYWSNNLKFKNYGRYTGWYYAFEDIYELAEPCLKKLPPEERTSWEDCEFVPDREGVNV